MNSETENPNQATVRGELPARARRSRQRTQITQRMHWSAGVRPFDGRTAWILAEEEVEQIHRTSLRVLEEVGVDFLHEDALALFRRNHGAKVDGARVRFSPELVEWAIDQAPKQITLRARDPEKDVILGQGQVYFTSGFGATFVCDTEKREYRKATLDDAADYIRLADYLDNVHYVLSPFVPQDVAPVHAEVYTAALLFAQTDKHIAVSLPGSDFLDDIWEMGQLVAEAAGRDGPLYSMGCTINSPLQYAHEALPKLIFCAEHNIPFKLVSGALAGATAPVTLAGALALQNAEILAGLTLGQLASLGCPFMYGTFVSGMDMRTGKWAAASPELSLTTSASAQLCRMYKIPFGYGTGGITDARVPDVRAGFEKGLTNLAAAMCGVEVVHDAVSGLLAGAMAVSLEQMAIENEFAGWVRHYLRGIPMDEGSLAYEVIKEVGPGANYLEQRHTSDRFRQEHHISALLGRDYLLEWPEAGDEEMVQRAREQVRDVLRDHRPAELDAAVKREMQEILTRIGGERGVFQV